jgi:hypothetical protein
MSNVDVNALKSEIRAALINQKANACPIAIRFAWHASGKLKEYLKGFFCCLFFFV